MKLSADTDVFSFAAGETRKLTGLADSDFINWTLDSSIFSSFTNAGGGSFDISCESLSSPTVAGGGGNVTSTQATHAQCGAEIDYFYDAAPPSNKVPEPAAPALVGIAMRGPWAARRRR